jgi:ribosome maturation factor RimP
VSHRLSELLESEDPIKGHYTLEVSSPGFDRILRKRAHFERFVGERIFAELKLPINGRRRFAGVLKSIAGDSIVMDVDGQPHELPLERIQKARLRPE